MNQSFGWRLLVYFAPAKTGVAFNLKVISFLLQFPTSLKSSSHKYTPMKTDLEGTVFIKVLVQFFFSLAVTID